MKIDVRQFPEAGLEVAGEAPASDYDLPKDLFLEPGPVQFTFRVEQAGPEFLVTGWFSMTFRLACSRCLEPISWTIRIDPFAASFVAAGTEMIDLTERMREDTLLALPMAPACVLDADERCPITGASYRRGQDAFADWHRIEAWEALNQFNPKQP
ncbi:MAG: DUF177 domain-containing protein [Candidatus Methylacidiphilales bacterium]